MQSVVRPRSLCAVALVVLVGAVESFAAIPPAVAASRPRHNILFVLTDDMALGDLAFMPNTRALIADQGATFNNYFVNSSVCCPSRATTLRGQYEHNTGVLSNGGSNGGFEKAYTSGIERDTIATHLHRAGYQTGLFGKYLNGYPNGAPETYVPPGWTDWASPVRGNAYGEYDYTLNENHVLRDYGHASNAYGTDVYVGLADQFIRTASAAGSPFFAYVSVYAPHEPATPAPTDVGTFPDAQVPRTASFNQADVSGMPKFVSSLPVLTPDEITSIDTLQRLRLESLQAVDRGVATLIATLRATHQLANTDIVFASDNGFHLGQHRLPAGKLTAYDTDIRVPLLIRGPGIAAGSHVRALTGNVDLTATFASMAGIKPPSFNDGRSLVRAAKGQSSSRWRHAYLIEHRNVTGTSNPPRVRTKLPLEPDDPDQATKTAAPGAASKLHDRTNMARDAHIPDYDAVRTTRYLYVKYADGEHELYDTRKDPEEIHNLTATGVDRRIETLLDRQLEELRHCAGNACRAAEARTPQQLAARAA